MEIHVNWLAIVLAAASTMVVGSVWYAKPVFGNRWLKLLPVKEKDLQKGTVAALGGALITALITAFVLAHLTYIVYDFFTDISFMTAALQTAMWAWIGFSVAALVTHNGFEHRPPMLTALSVGHELVKFFVMGLIIGGLTPSLI